MAIKRKLIIFYIIEDFMFVKNIFVVIRKFLEYKINGKIIISLKYLIEKV